MISFQQALELITQNVGPLGTDEVTLEQSVNRVLAMEVLADVDSPPHRKSLMDGFAVRSEDINSGLNRLRIVDTVVAGGWPSRPINTGEATRMMTGAAVPEGADAVVMVEQTGWLASSSETGWASSNREWVQVNLDKLEPNKHLALRADNFKKGQIIFPSGHRIRPWDVGLLAEVGASQLVVTRQPRVSILATGNELVDFRLIPQQGQIRNSNGPMLVALTRALGLAVELLPIAGDDRAELENLIQQGLQADLLILTGGVSVGMLDLVPTVLADLGVNQVFHKVAMKPGKPVWFGIKPSPTIGCVFGLPGNPVSSLVGFRLFAQTAICVMEGANLPIPSMIPAELAQNHMTRGDRDTFWPGNWITAGSVGRRVLPLDWKGSSDLLTLGRADCLIYFPGNRNDYRLGDEVCVLSLSQGLTI